MVRFRAELNSKAMTPTPRGDSLVVLWNEKKKQDELCIPDPESIDAH